jgi:hypothetical protein
MEGKTCASHDGWLVSPKTSRRSTRIEITPWARFRTLSETRTVASEKN